MSESETLQIIGIGFAILVSLASIWTAIGSGNPHDLKRRSLAQDLQLQDLHDRVEQWSKRDRTREFRERKSLQVGESEGAEPAAPVARNRKDMLRERVRAMRNRGA